MIQLPWSEVKSDMRRYQNEEKESTENKCNKKSRK